MSLREVDIWGARIRYQTELFERYHYGRAAQLLRWKNSIQILTIASGLPAISLLVQKLGSETAPILSSATAVIGAFIAVLAIFDQVYKFSDRAIEHRMAGAQYSEIAKEVRSKRLSLRDLERIQQRIDGISDVEPIKLLLEAQCHNALMQAYDFQNEFQIDVRPVVRAWRVLSGTSGRGLKPKKHLNSDLSGLVQRLGIGVADESAVAA